MKNSIHLILSLTIIVLFNACSSVKVLNSWKGDNVNGIKDNNILVIARTANTSARIAFENEIVNQLSERGINATASFTKFPKLKPDQKVTEDNQEEIKNVLKNEGFNGVIITVIKDTQEYTKTVTDDAHYSGGTYYGYYPRYYGGFYGYYHNPMSYSTYGNYVNSTSTTYSATDYILETAIYDLDAENENQLVAVVTSKIEDPENAGTTAKQYVKAITKSLNK